MIRTIAFAVALCLAAAPTLAGDAPPEMTPEQKAEMEAYMKAGTPGAPHKHLAASVGSFDVVVKSWNDASQKEPNVEKGTAVRTMDLDGRIVVERMDCTMMGMPFTGMGLTGYDNVSGKYWATWNDSMSTGIMVSSGTCDADRTCTFTGSWNDPIKKGPVTARMISREIDASTSTFEMYAPGKDGKEFKMMEMVYKRK